MAAADRLPDELQVEEVRVSETTDGDGGAVLRVRFVLADAPPRGFSSTVYWQISDVLDEVIRPLRPDALALPGFVTRAELEESANFVRAGSR